MGNDFQGVQKCTLKIGEEPLILRSVTNLVEAGIKEVVLLTGYKSKQVKDCFNGTIYEKYVKYVFCGDPYEIPLNTISTLRQAKNHINGIFLCVHGDILFRPTLVGQLYNDFSRYQSCLSISVSGRKDIALTHARVIYDNELQVTKIENYANSNADIWIGVDLCQPHVLDKYCGDEQKNQLELAQAILSNGELVRAVSYQHPWIHIVVPGDLKK